ncbi:MAG: PQQ-like beta-propeller repeat protein, partial [Streptomyces sp.]|nr:PQQ-like beta-propeller repeat protein [Streptomyces sp.]
MSPSPGRSPVPAGASWPAYQGGALQGVLPGATRFTTARRERWQAPALDGAVWGSPIVAGNLVVIATENDTVYAFPPTGSANWNPTWTRHLASPVPSSELQCGDISPVSGITSTPVADTNSDRLYVVAFVQPGRHVLYTLDLKTGRVLSHQTVDPPGESPLFEQQRGALKLANGRVYIPFGGLDGDCGSYHGWLIGASVGQSAMVTFRPPVCPNECAFWAPGGVTLGSDGDVWVASGNSNGASGSFDYSNTLFRLSPDLHLLNWFAPPNWRALSESDQDLGSTSPVLLSNGLVFIAGKQGIAYVLRQDDLGHIGPGAASGQACPGFAAAVAVGDVVYLSCWGPDEVLALHVDLAAPSLARGWKQSVDVPGGLIAAYGAIWVVASSGSLEALDPTTGVVRFSTAAGPSPHVTPPAAANGHVYAV